MRKLLDLPRVASAFPLVDGRTYVDGWGTPHRVVGPTSENDAWVYTNTGFWYNRATGQKLDYTDRGRWMHTEGSIWNLRQLAEGEEAAS